MTDQNAQEPTMEEILASIRRIISEDEAPAETLPAAAAAEPAAEPAPVEPEPAPEAAAEPVVPEVVSEAASEIAPEPAPEPVPVAEAEDVLELTQRYEPPAEESIGDLDVSLAPEPFPVAAAPEPSPEPAPQPEPAPALVGADAAASAASAFAGLSAALKAPEPAADIAVGGGQTIDELVRGLLRPLLKDWLDANLPGIVEESVRKEVERIARNAG